MKKLYLACPYSHESWMIRHDRFLAANRVAAQLMGGYTVFSPLSHSVPIADKLNNHMSHDFWLAQDMPWLECCDIFAILCLKGWEESRGVQEELKRAKELGLEIMYLNPTEEGLKDVG